MDTLYNINSSGDIVNVLVTPANEALCDININTISITDYESVSYIYYVMSEMTCCSYGDWDLISDYPNHDFSDIFADAVRVDLVTQSGEVIENFYYSDLSGRFFEYEHGLAYSKVSENARERLYDILYSELPASGTFKDTLDTANINSAADLSSVVMLAPGPTEDTTNMAIVTDTEDFEQLYDILSKMTVSTATSLDELETVYDGPTYDVELFNLQGSCTTILTYYGEYHCFCNGDTIYNTLSDEDCEYLNELYYVNFADVITP